MISSRPLDQDRVADSIMLVSHNVPNMQQWSSNFERLSLPFPSQNRAYDYLISTQYDLINTPVIKK